MLSPWQRAVAARTRAGLPTHRRGSELSKLKKSERGALRSFMNSHLSLFVVQHLHVLDGGEENVKLIGVYSTRDAAQAAVDRLKLKPWFRDTLDGFSIDPYTIDEDNWTEGYYIYHYSDDSDKGGMSPPDVGPE
jgi:hypothetical protein